VTVPIDAVELSRTLLRFNTINPPGNERPCAEYLARLLEAAGFAVSLHEYAPARTSLVAHIGNGSGSPICFAGHIDIVPLGAAPWSHDPFAGDIVGGRLCGRGSTDMKCGVAAFVVAAIGLAKHVDETAGVTLVIVAGEETGCDGSRHLARSAALGRAGALVVAEPTSNRVLLGHKGALWLQAVTTGKTAHGSMPERGVNAIHKAARAVTNLQRFEFDVVPHPVLGSPTLNVGTIAGGMNVNSVPDRATIGIDIRTIPGQRHAGVQERLAHFLGTEVSLTAVVDVESVWTDPADPWVQELFELADDRTVSGAPYFTDASLLTPAFGGPPTVILGPGEPGLAHQTDEYCLVERIERAVELYSEIALRWCRVGSGAS
jgi:succinyl-diaminopimelate desuccinylase